MRSKRKSRKGRGSKNIYGSSSRRRKHSRKRSRRGSSFFSDIGDTFKTAFSKASDILTGTPLKHIPGIDTVGKIYKTISGGKRRRSSKRSRKSSKRRSRSRSKVRIPISNKGGLLGYHIDQKLATRQRHLRQAIKRYGALKIFHRLNALVVFSKNRPSIKKIVMRDRNWVKQFLNGKRSSKRKGGNASNYLRRNEPAYGNVNVRVGSSKRRSKRRSSKRKSRK